jgi:hypothetical protein
MTSNPGRQSGLRSGVAGAILAAILAIPEMPAAQQPAADCTVGKLSDWVTTSTQHEIADENFACLQRRIEALEQERDSLARRLGQLEDRETLAATVYLNRNGEVTRDGRHLGPATFVLTGDRRGRPRSLELDRERIAGMCGDAEGCLISLGLGGIVIGDTPVEAMFAAGPCIFHLDETENAWAVSGHCAEAGLPAPASSGVPEGGRAAWGRDGDARPMGGAMQEGRVILAFGGACLLTEAQPDTRSISADEPRFERDASPDLFLVTTGAGWAPAGPFPADLLPLGLSDPDFQCTLTIRD